jgi:hypothetical protein
MLRRLLKLTCLIFLGIIVVGSSSAYALAYPAHQTGVDISWPNCDLKNFSLSHDSFGIVGVNDGLGLTSNKCLGEEAAQFRSNLSLYVNTGYPGRNYALPFMSSPKSCTVNDNACLAYNFGYNAGKYAVNYAYKQGVVAKNWWLDVETVNSWSNNPTYNIASLSGEVQAIKNLAGASQVGFYSTQLQWSIITNNWQNGDVNWLASNSNYRDVAVAACNLNFSSHMTKLVQYIAKLDTDYTC